MKEKFKKIYEYLEKDISEIEVKKGDKIIKLAIKYGIIIIVALFLFGIIANAPDLLKEYSESQERKEIIKFL